MPKEDTPLSSMEIDDTGISTGLLSPLFPLSPEPDDVLEDAADVGSPPRNDAAPVMQPVNPNPQTQPSFEIVGGVTSAEGNEGGQKTAISNGPLASSRRDSDATPDPVTSTLTDRVPAQNQRTSSKSIPQIGRPTTSATISSRPANNAAHSSLNSTSRRESTGQTSRNNSLPNGQEASQSSTFGISTKQRIAAQNLNLFLPLGRSQTKDPRRPSVAIKPSEMQEGNNNNDR